MISQTAEYALRAIVFLADNDGKSCTTQQIAEVTEVPAGYLSKVMQSLSRSKLVNSQRGIHGGFTLSKESSKLTVLEIINAVDPVQRIHECPLKIANHGKNLCPLHRKLDNAAAAVETAFAETTIDNLLAVPKSRKPLCRFPADSPDAKAE